MIATATTIDFNVNILLENADFLRYVLDSDERLTTYWEHFVAEHEEYKPAVERAKYILQHLDSPCDFLSCEEIENLKIRIKNTISV